MGSFLELEYITVVEVVIVIVVRCADDGAVVAPQSKEVVSTLYNSFGDMFALNVFHNLSYYY